MKVRRWLRELLATPSAVYGLILYQALIAAVVGDDDPMIETWLATIFSVISLLIFFSAHVFAEWVAAHGPLNARGAFRRAVAHSAGMLISAVPSTVILIVCSFLGIAAEPAEDLALLSAVVVLGYLGYEAFAQRGAAMWARILGGALGTALLGTFVIFLNFLVH